MDCGTRDGHFVAEVLIQLDAAAAQSPSLPVFARDGKLAGFVTLLQTASHDCCIAHSFRSLVLRLRCRACCCARDFTFDWWPILRDGEPPDVRVGMRAMDYQADKDKRTSNGSDYEG